MAHMYRQNQDVVEFRSRFVKPDKTNILDSPIRESDLSQSELHWAKLTDPVFLAGCG